MNNATWTRDESFERFPNQLSPMGWSILQFAFERNLKSLQMNLGFKSFEPQQVSRWISGYVYTRKDFFKSDLQRKLRITFQFKILLGCLVAVAKTILLSPFQRQFALYDRLPLWGPLFDFTVALFHQDYFGISPHKPRFLFQTLAIEEIFGKGMKSTLQRWKKELPTHLARQRGLRHKIQGMDLLRPVTARRITDDLRQAGDDFMELDFAIYFYKEFLFHWLKTSFARHHLEVDLVGLAASHTQTMPEMIKSELGRMKQEVSDASAYPAWIRENLGHLTENWDVTHPLWIDAKGLNVFLSEFMGQTEAGRNRTKTFQSLLLINDPRKVYIERLLAFVEADDEHRFYASFQYPGLQFILEKWKNHFTCDYDPAYADYLPYFTWQELLDSIETKLPPSLAVAKLRKMRMSESDGSREFTEKDLQPLPGDLWAIQINSENKESAKSPTKSQRIFTAKDHFWRGQMASPGSVEGPALKISCTEDLSRIQPDHLVVVESLNPVWAMACMKARGIISERGGILGHACLIARENGIPMTTQVHGIFSEIQDGDCLRIEDNSGLIFLVRRAFEQTDFTL